jgi:hypothetical protein
MLPVVVGCLGATALAHQLLSIDLFEYMYTRSGQVIWTPIRTDIFLFYYFLIHVTSPLSPLQV